MNKRRKQQRKPQKPRLFLMRGNATAEELAVLFEKLTGRKPTTQEIEEAKAAIKQRDAALACAKRAQ